MSDNLSFTQSLREEGFIITNINKNAASPAKSGSNGSSSSISGSTNMIAAAIIVIALVLIMVFIR